MHAHLKVTSQDGRTVFAFVSKESAASVPVSLLVVVDERGHMLWLVASVTEASAEGPTLTSANSECPAPTTVGRPARALSSLVYGEVPPRFEQLAPEAGAPPPLTRGAYKVFFGEAPHGCGHFVVS
jgi:hypothetical protein